MMDVTRVAPLCVTVALVVSVAAGETYDLVISGGTLDAVRLAVREVKAGRRVYLAAPRPYLGEDRAATLILDRLPTDDINDPLIREIFNPSYRAAGAYNALKPKGRRLPDKLAPYENVETEPVPPGELDKVTTPFIVKRACDKALLAAGANYLTGAQVIAHEAADGGMVRVTVAMRGRDVDVMARRFVDLRMPARVAKGRGKFAFRYVTNASGKVRVEKIDFEYDVPHSGVRGWMAVQNHARTLVPISKDLLDVAEMVTVEVNDANIHVARVEVFNVYGQLIHVITSSENPLRINISSLADGMYYVRVTTDSGVVTKNFVKK